MNPENLLQLSTQKCTLGCPILDRVLAGGIPCNSITELVSESGCGKTQLCLQLLLSAQLPISHGGLNSSSLYIHSEFSFPFRRLQQLSLSFRSSHPLLFRSHDPCDRIFVRGVQSAEELLGLLDRLDSLITNPPSQLPVKLIVIDSIAALFRSEFENTSVDLKRRSSLFFKISGKLKLQAKKFSLAVVVTNQVVDLIGNEGINGMRVGNLGFLSTSGRRVCPALGLAWSNCINSRLFLSRNEEVVSSETGLEDSNGGLRTRRRLQVIFAPHLPESSCEFVIVREGVFGIDL
ncbi:DNA recombination and repair protein Rad51 [Macleaya cordata]|uniref:DNA recombination and repair protein Rad51 n=1 Tax=Macleaya cordata TaxID=56857 RepID=A0A200PLJ6_MACCD|nr:DNA recombination and repair protein Rad51 [Macleaya cordata]